MKIWKQRLEAQHEARLAKRRWRAWQSAIDATAAAAAIDEVDPNDLAVVLAA